jgi:hypothetical protein
MEKNVCTGNPHVVHLSLLLKAWSFANPRNPLEVVDILITEDARKISTVNKRAFGYHEISS